MLQFTTGNLLDADVEALVNAVNTVGVMGKGIALLFCKQFPEIMPAYQAACKDGTLAIGIVQAVPLVQIQGKSGPSYVINFPTKEHWRGKSKLEFIESGLESLRKEIGRLGIKSIALPPLGCGLGGLHWNDVRKRIVDSLGDLPDVRIAVFEP